MFRKIVADSLPSFDTIVFLAQRNLSLQLSTVFLICGFTWYAGYPKVAVTISVFVTVNELLIYHILNRKTFFVAMTASRALGISLLLSAANSAIYLIPSIAFAAHPSIAVKITSLMWIMGVQVYLANTWARVPAFLVAMLSPAMLMMVIVFFRLKSTVPTDSTAWEWGVAFGFMLIFLYSLFVTLLQNLQTKLKLAKARQDASSRLAKLEEDSRLDALTGLLNRTSFDRALNDMLLNREVEGGEVTTLLIDLDSFKPINDTYSHVAGDAVLVETARRITRLLGETGIVGRMGGDEFICARNDLRTEADALELAAALGQGLSGGITWNGRQLRTAASIGIAMTGHNAGAPMATLSALCAAADQAMFVAKNAPNRAPVLYHAERFRPRMTPDDKQILIESIADETIRPFYQPKVHLASGQIVGFEALARWKHPADGERSPADFIEQINELGLQGDFMMSMARQVFRDVDIMLSRGLDPGQVSLNVSEVALATFSGRQDLHRIVAAHPKAARYMTFEITEDVFIARAADAIQTSIKTFRGLGVKISLDDFGTGFASFDHLRRLDFDELKIDTSFVEGLDHDPTLQVLVQGFLHIASGLGVGVIAEGVETAAQRRELSNMGCVVAQGYLFSPAVPFDSAAEMLAKQAA